jgi:Holliday junction resolvase
MTEEEVRSVFEKFKQSRFTLRTFAPRHGFGPAGMAELFRKFFPEEYAAVIKDRCRHDLLYKRGRNFEYIVARAFRLLGWWVLRSPQSRSPIDLLAVKAGRILAIQCKRGASITVAQKQELIDLAKSLGAMAILATRESPKKRKLVLLGTDETVAFSSEHEVDAFILAKIAEAVFGDPGPLTQFQIEVVKRCKRNLAAQTMESDNKSVKP